MKITDRDKSNVQISQAHYCNTVLKRFGYDNCFPSKLPCVKDVHNVLKENINSPKLDSEGTTKYRELVGSLIYLEQITRPDISFIVNILGQQMHSPSKAHWNLGVRVLKYLKGTQNYCLNYYESVHLELTLFGDADWANDTQDRKSQTGYCAYLSDISSPISWSSRKQQLVATSTTNAEYVALSNTTCEAIWLQKLLRDINCNIVKFWPARLLCDNTGALALAHHPATGHRSKHIDVRYHVVRDYVEWGDITLEHVRSDQNWADGFTKSLGPNLYKDFVMNMFKATPRKHIIKVTNKLPDLPYG